MEQYKNIHDGERLFILGNGPSLNNTPLDKLGHEVTMAMNRIDLIYNKTSWRPTYHLYYDVAYGRDPDEWIDSVKNGIHSAETSFIAEQGRKIFDDDEDIEYFTPKNISKELDTEDLQKKREAIRTENIGNIWSNDISTHVCNFGSTISAAAQIANYMGFDRIYFVGTDLYDEAQHDSVFPIYENARDPAKYSFNANSRFSNIVRFVSSSDAKIKSIINLLSYALISYFPYKILGKHNHHFSNNYTQYEFNAEKLNRNLRETHEVIKIASKRYNFEVYNATVGGSLEVYDRVDIQNIL